MVLSQAALPGTSITFLDYPSRALTRKDPGPRGQLQRTVIPSSS